MFLCDEVLWFMEPGGLTYLQFYFLVLSMERRFGSDPSNHLVHKEAEHFFKEIDSGKDGKIDEDEARDWEHRLLGRIL